jgi:predicted amidohydrolase
MKIALSQWHLPILDRLAKLEHDAMTAASACCDLLVVPELAFPGYNCPELHMQDAQTINGSWMKRVSEITQKAGIAICFGWAERDGNTVYNATSVISNDGICVAHYRKLQLFGAFERNSFTFGDDKPPVFDLCGTPCGVLICYDIEFPEHARDLARCGAKLILVPTANPEGFSQVPDLLVRSRAYENGVFVAYANYSGDDGDLIFGGGSVICGPDGAVIALAGKGDVILIADIADANAFFKNKLSTQLQDLREV